MSRVRASLWQFTNDDIGYILEQFEAIGRLYGVTGKAVTKWCLSYGLPSTRKEIKEAVKRKEIA